MAKIEKEFTITNKQGLHARPAALFVQIAEKYDSEITVVKDQEQVNGKSIMGLLMLGAHYQSKVLIIIDGPDSDGAMSDIERFFDSNIEPA
ncbi:HPr family phosphocarrier protein [Patescibacteria group bacterium]|nr:MAG: HPr family phosphocarrier protein [Patescibacteria group bacterium]